MKKRTRIDAGLARPRMWKPATLEIISLLRKGKTPREIRAIVKGSRGDTIRRIAINIGIKPFAAGSPLGTHDPKRLKAIQKMRAGGATYEKIATRFGVTSQAIHQLLSYRKNISSVKNASADNGK